MDTSALTGSLEEGGESMREDNHRTAQAELTQLQRKIVDASLTIADLTPDRPEFLHAVLCQVGLPRSRQEKRVFERACGNASLLLEAGQRSIGIGKWQECPLPYGAQPRLVLYHLCSEAVRTQSNVVDVGGSVRGFLQRVGISFGGKEFNRFKEQMTALSCCRMTLAYVAPDGRLSQMQATPIDSFDAWLHPDPAQGAFWPCRNLRAKSADLKND